MDLFKKYLDFSIKSSTTRVSALVMMGASVFVALGVGGNYAEAVAIWAAGSALWGIRNKLDN